MQSLESRLARTHRYRMVFPTTLEVDAVDHVAEEVRVSDSRARCSTASLKRYATLMSVSDVKGRTAGGCAPEDIDASDVKAATDEVGVALVALARRPRLVARRRTRERRMAAVSSMLQRFGERMPHLRERTLSCIGQVDPGQPELGATEARDAFAQVAREALDSAEKATTRRRLDEARADIEKRMARARAAVAALGDCAPYLRERADACLRAVWTLSRAEPGIHEAGAMLQEVFMQARTDAKSLAVRRRLEALRKRLQGLPRRRTTPRTTCGNSPSSAPRRAWLFSGRNVRQMQTDRPEAWQAAGRLASRIQAAAKRQRARLRSACPGSPGAICSTRVVRYEPVGTRHAASGVRPVRSGRD